VGVLSHYIEEAGIATTGISLVRPHTEQIKPPRALWVPFQFGHPLGPPDTPAFQTRVVRKALELLESAGPPPILEDFPDDEPENDDIAALACPVVYKEHAVNRDAATDPLLATFRREIAALRPWYETGMRTRQRTTVGVSRVPIDELADFIYAFIEGAEPGNPDPSTPIIYSLKYAVEDIKSYYVESITSQPGQAGASSRRLQDWFWDETTAGEVLLKLKQVCEASKDKLTAMMASHFFVPGDVVRRKAGMAD